MLRCCKCKPFTVWRRDLFYGKLPYHVLEMLVTLCYITCPNKSEEQRGWGKENTKFLFFISLGQKLQSNFELLIRSCITLKKKMVYRKCFHDFTNICVQVLVKWYNIYNAPGGPSTHAEWNLFVTCFMTLMGYNTERLAWMEHVSQRLCFPLLFFICCSVKCWDTHLIVD